MLGDNAPQDWGIADKTEWVAEKPFKGEAKMPPLEGRDVVGYSESINFAAGQFIPDNVKQMAAGQPNYTFTNPQTGRTYLKRNGHWTVSGQDGKEVQKRMSNAVDRGNVPRERADEPKPQPETKPKLKSKPRQETQPEPKQEQQSKGKEKSPELTGIQSANEQRKQVLERRGLNSGDYFDQFKEKISKKLGNDPRLSSAANGVLSTLGLFLDGDGKRLSGDVVKEAPDNPQSEKKFSFEYVINKDGSMTQRDPSAEGEQRGFRNYGELQSILEGPIKRALLAAGLSEEDLNEHPPQKPGRGATPEQKQKYKQDLEDYQTGERRRNKIADEISSEVIQKHLQSAESEKIGGPLDFFKDLSDEEQNQIVNAIWTYVDKTPLGGKFNSIGSPRKNIFGGYDKDRNPIYVKKAGSIRGKAMLKKYLQQGGIDTYTLDKVLMSPYALTIDHVKPEARGGGDHPDNGAFTRGGLNTQLSDNNFLWLYRQAKGEKERLDSLTPDPVEQKRIYDDAKKAAYTTQFGTSVALSEAGTGANLTTRALQNSSGNLTGDIKKDLALIASGISEKDIEEIAPGSILDVSSKEVIDFIKKKAPGFVGLSYFGTSHPDAEKSSEKPMSSGMKDLIWNGAANKLNQGATLEEIKLKTDDIKNHLAAGLLPEGSKAEKRYNSRIKANTRSEAFSEGISLLSDFLGRDVQESEIQFIRKQF